MNKPNVTPHRTRRGYIFLIEMQKWLGKISGWIFSPAREIQAAVLDVSDHRKALGYKPFSEDLLIHFSALKMDERGFLSNPSLIWGNLD